LDRALTRTTESDTLLHDGTDIKTVCGGGVVGNEGNGAELTDGADLLVEDFRGVSLKANGALHGVEDALGKAEAGGIDDTVDSDGDLLADLGHNIGRLVGKDAFNAEGLDGKIDTLLVRVDTDDARSALDKGPLGSEQTNRAETPDGDSGAGSDVGALHCVVGGGNDIGEVEALLIWNIIWELEKICVCERNTDVLGLTAGETSNEVGVAKDSSDLGSEHLLLNVGVVGRVTHGGKALLAECATATAVNLLADARERSTEDSDSPNLETAHDSVSNLEVLYVWSNLIYNSTKLMAQDVSILQLNDIFVIEMQVRAADCGTSDFDDDIVWLGDGWSGNLLNADSLCTVPSQGFHGLTTSSWLVLCSG
jgi:hypothetical protein